LALFYLKDANFRYILYLVELHLAMQTVLLILTHCHVAWSVCLSHCIRFGSLPQRKQIFEGQTPLLRQIANCCCQLANRKPANPPVVRLVWSLFLGLERYQKSYLVPSTQYYSVLLMPTPNANTDIGFLPHFLLELDMRSEVCCANRATGPMVLTKH